MTARTIIFPVSDEDCEQLDKWFNLAQQDTNELQDIAISEITDAAEAFCYAILSSLPKCADRSASLRKVREIVHTATAAVFTEQGAYINRTPIRNG